MPNCVPRGGGFTFVLNDRTYIGGLKGEYAQKSRESRESCNIATDGIKTLAAAPKHQVTGDSLPRLSFVLPAELCLGHQPSNHSRIRKRIRKTNSRRTFGLGLDGLVFANVSTFEARILSMHEIPRNEEPLTKLDACGRA